MIESEKQLIRRFQTEPSKVICLLCGTSKEIELCNIIQSGDFWNEWVDAFAHDAPPPDFYSNKYGLMMDVMKVDDNTRKTKKGKLRNPRAELENKLQEEVAELLEAYTAKERSVLDCAEEMADVMEVLYAMSKTCAVSKREIEQVRSQKAAEKGTFSKKIFLVSTEK